MELLQRLLRKKPRMSDFGLEPIHIAAYQGGAGPLTSLLNYERRQTSSLKRMLEVQILHPEDARRFCLGPEVLTDVYQI